MFNTILFIIFGIVAYLLELHITTIPLVVGICIVAFILYRSSYVFLLAFFLGLFLDLSNITRLGYTSVFLVSVLFLVALYQRKFEIKTYPFVFFSSFIASLIFLALQREPYVLQQSFVAACFSLLWYRTRQV